MEMNAEKERTVSPEVRAVTIRTLTKWRAMRLGRMDRTVGSPSELLQDEAIVRRNQALAAEAQGLALAERIRNLRGGKVLKTLRYPKKKDGTPDWLGLRIAIQTPMVTPDGHEGKPEMREVAPEGVYRDCRTCGASFFLEVYAFGLDRQAFDYGLPEDILTEYRKACFYQRALCERCSPSVIYGQRPEKAVWALAGTLKEQGWDVVKGRTTAPGTVSWWDLFHRSFSLRKDPRGLNVYAEVKSTYRPACQDAEYPSARLSRSMLEALPEVEVEALSAEDGEGWQSSAYDGEPSEVEGDAWFGPVAERAQLHMTEVLGVVGVTTPQQRYAEAYTRKRLTEMDELLEQENSAWLGKLVESSDPAVRNWANQNAALLRHLVVERPRVQEEPVQPVAPVKRKRAVRKPAVRKLASRRKAKA